MHLPSQIGFKNICFYVLGFFFGIPLGRGVPKNFGLLRSPVRTPLSKTLKPPLFVLKTGFNDFLYIKMNNTQIWYGEFNQYELLTKPNIQCSIFYFLLKYLKLSVCVCRMWIITTAFQFTLVLLVYQKKIFQNRSTQSAAFCVLQ